MVFSFALAVLYEGLKTVKDTLAKKTQKFVYPSHSTNADGADLHTYIPHRS